MQKNREDYSDAEIGCCLNCEDAEPGCLCPNCCCTDCYWYCKPNIFIEDSKGSCDYIKQSKITRVPTNKLPPLCLCEKCHKYNTIQWYYKEKKICDDCLDAILDHEDEGEY